LEGNRQKSRLTNGINCSIRLHFYGKKPEGRPVTNAQSPQVNQARCPQLNTPHGTLREVLQERLRFKSQKYQLLRHLTVQEIPYTLSSDFLPRLEDAEVFTAKFFAVMKPHSIYREILIDVTPEFVAAGRREVVTARSLTTPSLNKCKMKMTQKPDDVTNSNACDFHSRAF
jgi:hypothetical protein